MGLTAFERETVVSFNDAEEMALVVTQQRRVITALKNNPAAVLLAEGVFETSRWARFAIPKRLVSFRTRNRVFSEAERARRAAQLATARNGRAEADHADSSRRSSSASGSATSGSIEAGDSGLSTPIVVSPIGVGDSVRVREGEVA